MSTERLLREYSKLIIEKIRTINYKKGESEFGTKFNLNKFKSLEDITDMVSYADNFLDKLGEGSSRVAFVFSSKYALKIAKNDAGIAQNKSEIDISTTSTKKMLSVLSQVHDYEPGAKWVISDLVRELKSEKEFERLTGENFFSFIKKLYDAEAFHVLADGASEFLKNVFLVTEQYELMVGDLDNVNHWGVTPDRRVVILDYGFTNEVWEKHYSDD